MYLRTKLSDNYVGMGGSKNAQQLVWRVYPVPLDRRVSRTHPQR